MTKFQNVMSGKLPNGKLKESECQILAREEVFRQSEIEDALLQINPSTIRIRSKKEYRNHIITIAKQAGFDLFMNTKFGYEDFTVKTRVKFYRKYGNPPVTKYLVIPNGLVGRLFSIYKIWRELSEFLLRTLLCHERQHLLQDPTKFENLSAMEEKANKLMMEKMGRPGLVVCAWYFCLFGKLGILNHILSRKKKLEEKEATKKIRNFLEKNYLNLISSNEYDEIIDDVLWLNAKYLKSKKSV